MNEVRNAMIAKVQTLGTKQIKEMHATLTEKGELSVEEFLIEQIILEVLESRMSEKEFLDYMESTLENI